MTEIYNLLIFNKLKKHLQLRWNFLSRNEQLSIIHKYTLNRIDNFSDYEMAESHEEQFCT